MNHDIMKAPTKEDALKLCLDSWKFEPEIEIVSLEESLGRVSASDIVSVNKIPLMRVSAMDGFAVKSANFKEGNPDVSKWVLGEDYTPADTGDDFPDEYDTVIPVEMLHYDENKVLTLEEAFEFKLGGGIRPEGSMMLPGDMLVRKNTRITPDLRANLAIGGIEEVPVIKKPKVAFIPTGSELIPAGQKPGRGENIDSNSVMISGYLSEWGAEPICFPIIKDDPEKLEATLNEAINTCDIVLINGGSSKGTEDFNSRLLEKRATVFSHSVRTVPGRPTGISIIDEKPVINLPGPVLAAWVSSDWLIYPMICHWFDIKPEKRQVINAFLTTDFKKGPPVEFYGRVALEKREGMYYATPFERSSRNSQTLLDGIGLLVGPIGKTGFAKGQSVKIQLLRNEEQIPVTEEAPHIEIPENCSQCVRGCSTKKLSCGRGRVYLERIKNGDIFTCDSEIANAFVECAHELKFKAEKMLQHGEDTANILAGLTKEEQEQLLVLVNKQRQYWNDEHAKRHGIKK